MRSDLLRHRPEPRHAPAMQALVLVDEREPRLLEAPRLVDEDRRVRTEVRGGRRPEHVDVTRRFEQARFAFVDEDEHLHRWCVDGLRAVGAER